MVPGRILHRLAKRFCSAKTLERVVEPAIADLQKEYLDAIGEGRAWYDRWILFVSYVGVAKTLAMCGLDGLFGNSPYVADERAGLRRTLVWSTVLMVAMTAVLMVPPLQHVPSDARAGFRNHFLMALIPQALPLAIPVGLTLGVAIGVHGTLTRRHRRRVLALAAAGAAASFVILLWVMPAANQTFRAHVAQASGHGYPTKGSNEMTLAELAQEINTAVALGMPSRARELAFARALRWSLAVGVMALVLFATTVSRQRIALRLSLGVLACAMYWFFLYVGEVLVRQQYAAASVGAWLPNAVFIGISAGLLNKNKQRFPDPIR